MTVWRHSIPSIVVVEKKGEEPFAHVWSRPHTCHETPEVLEKMYWREEKGNPRAERTAPVERCGVCKLVEWAWQQCWAWLDTHKWVAAKDDDGKRRGGKWVEVAKGKGEGLDPCATVFDLTGDDERERTLVHLGGLCGLFGRKEIPDDLEKALKARGIFVKDAWKEKIVAKPMSVMLIVANDKPENGVVISEETKELGEKMKEKIVEMLDGQDMDIQKRPYCMRWSYDRSAQMGKQYKVTPMLKIKPTSRVLGLIRGEAPDLDDVTEPFNQQQMRATLERHCKLEGVPWAELFPSSEQEKKWAAEAAEDAEAADDEPEEDDSADDDEDEVAEDGADEKEDGADFDDDGDELVACVECEKPMKLKLSTCPSCGADQEANAEDDEAEEEAEEEKPPPRTRAEAKGAAKTPPRKGAAKAPPRGDDGDPADVDDDEAPF
jgi:hypothetical protein